MTGVQTCALPILGKGQQAYGVSRDELAQMTSESFENLSVDNLSTQSAEALVNAYDKGGLAKSRAAEVSDNSRYMGQASGKTAPVFKALGQEGQPNLQSAIDAIKSNMASSQSTPSQAPSMTPEKYYAIKEQVRGADTPQPPQVNVTIQADRSSNPKSATSIPYQGDVDGGGQSQNRRN